LHIVSTISRYRIVEKLGEGGMGVVYRAERATLEPSVSLKFLADHLLLDDEGKERFLRGANAAAALHHSNVRPVYEIDEVAIRSWGPGPCFRRRLGYRRDASF
jgi:serine/threonine protein kinase